MIGKPAVKLLGNFSEIVNSRLGKTAMHTQELYILVQDELTGVRRLLLGDKSLDPKISQEAIYSR